ncbi:MAG TPA: hypothetical protein VMR34_02650 [Candidatus Saccharimonadales bacterium]|nr:hypothetical protein [Candidatus Saccharimonadales bacterium]
MTGIERVQLYTVPSTYVHLNGRTTKQPYRRVVGMEIVQDMSPTRWTRVDYTVPESGYNPKDAELEVIEMPEDVARKLGEFYTRFFVDKPRFNQVRSEYTGLMVPGRR